MFVHRCMVISHKPLAQTNIPSYILGKTKRKKYFTLETKWDSVLLVFWGNLSCHLTSRLRLLRRAQTVTPTFCPLKQSSGAFLQISFVVIPSFPDGQKHTDDTHGCRLFSNFSSNINKLSFSGTLENMKNININGQRNNYSIKF